MSTPLPPITIRGDTSLVLNRSTTRFGSPATKPLQIFLNIHKVSEGEEEGWNVEVAVGKKENIVTTLLLGSYDSGEVGDYDSWFLPDNCAVIKLPDEFSVLKNQLLVVFSSYAYEDGSQEIEVQSDFLLINSLPPTPPNNPK